MDWQLDLDLLTTILRCRPELGRRTNSSMAIRNYLCIHRKVIIYIIIDKLEHKPDKGPIWEGLIWEGMGFTPGQIIHST